MARRLVVTENITLDGVIDAAGDWFNPAGTDGDVDQSDVVEAPRPRVARPRRLHADGMDDHRTRPLARLRLGHGRRDTTERAARGSWLRTDAAAVSTISGRSDRNDALATLT